MLSEFCIDSMIVSGRRYCMLRCVRVCSVEWRCQESDSYRGSVLSLL